MADSGITTETERLRRLQAVTDAALASLELDRLLGELLARLREALEVDTVAILLLDESGRELVARAAVGIEEEVERGLRVPVGKGFAGRVAAERRAISLSVVDHTDVLNPILREKGVKSLLGVPLTVGDDVVGVLHVGSLTPRDFTSRDADFLQVAADRAAIAIEHARLFEAERRARQRLEDVQAVTDAALAHLELDELLQELLQRIRAILRADTSAVLLLDDERDELVARAAVGLEEEVEQGVRIPIGAGFAGRIVAERRPIYLAHVDETNVVNRILIDKGIASMLGVPLFLGDSPIGVLHVGTLTPRQFGADDVDLLQLVAERVALAIEKARVHQEVVELDQLKMNFVAIASHELRTPAASVYGALTTLVSRGDELSEEIQEELLQVSWEQSDRLRRLIEQLLDLSRLDAKSIAVSPEPLVLRSVVREIVRAAGAEHAVSIDVPPELAVVADRLVLDRVLTNLLQNALRHGEPPIVVAAQQQDRHLRVFVADTGSGVPEELQPRLFERFARAGPSPGSGLGLAIARAYAQAHGGDLVYRAGAQPAFELIVPRQR